MQDRYVGDIGDFGKYALLQALFGPADGSSGRTLSLGIVWYLMPDEESSGDGSLLRYLEPTPGNLALYRDCDPILYDTLGSLVSTSNRSVAALRESGVLPPGTVSYEEPFVFCRYPRQRAHYSPRQAYPPRPLGAERRRCHREMRGGLCGPGQRVGGRRSAHTPQAGAQVCLLG